MVHPLWPTFLDPQTASLLIVFADELRYSGGCGSVPIQVMKWVEKQDFCFVANPVPTYRHGLWARILDRFRITLIM